MREDKRSIHNVLRKATRAQVVALDDPKTQLKVKFHLLSYFGKERAGAENRVQVNQGGHLAHRYR